MKMNSQHKSEKLHEPESTLGKSASSISSDDVSGWPCNAHPSVIVAKLGGSTLGSHDTTMKNLVSLQRRGTQPIVVHGGAKIITEWMERQGVRPRFVRGLRVTDKSSLEIVVAVLTGLINKLLVAEITALGGKAVGLSGVDGGMLRAKIIDPELGLVGDIVNVDMGPIKAAFSAGFMPVIAPVAIRNCSGLMRTESAFLNVNADTAAGEIATAIEADRLVFMTDVEGVMDSSRRVMSRLTKSQAGGLMQSGVVSGGMLPKIAASLKALEVVKQAHIVDGRVANALMDCLSNKDIGTRVG